VNVLVLLGSLRPDSLNSRLAEAAIRHLPDGSIALVHDGLAELPHYSEDLDGADAPNSVVELRAAVEAADALLLVTPEYNGSLPSVLKNAIDWLSRPRGQAPLAGKPVAVLAASLSPRGGLWAREDAIRILKVAGAAPLDISVGVGSAHDAFGEHGLVDADLDAAVRSLVTRLADQTDVAA
jgi:NAD(P)H-dependent FMN reductase